MAKKPRRRQFRRPNPRQRNEDAIHQQRGLEAAAQALLASRTPEQIRLELAEREALLAEADQAAQLDPNPANLARYRFAVSQHQAARVALEMSNRASPTEVS
jgi:hypothetical protein